MEGRPSTRQKLVCPVRGCGRPLGLGPRAARCAAGHSYDVSRRGYLNLLRPSDKRAPVAGDGRDVVRARGRLLDAGAGDALLRALGEEIDGLGLAPGAALLDVGCGDGFLVSRLCPPRGLETWGTDISVEALSAAARRLRTGTWIAANADRTLPFADHAFDVLLCVDSRRNPAETSRILAPGGRLLLAVPAPDDLAELRAAVQGRAADKDRAAGVKEAFAASFAVESEREIRQTFAADAALLADLLLVTYRGRTSALGRVSGAGPLEVTAAHRVLRLRPRLSGGPVSRTLAGMNRRER
jgi:23S rRNA (guanine745-N1)-methyltransferase